MSSVWESVGNTPLIRIKSLSEITGCEIYGKAEFLNPGGSVKDRAAKGIIAAAEQQGLLKPGGVIVEGTAGNTGIGLATLAPERGYRVIVSIPDNQAPEKYQMLEALGVDVRKFAPVPFANPAHFYHQAQRISAEMEGAFWANQFENTANSQIHYTTTGPEIWSQTGGRVDVFACAVGSGGTMGGVSRFLKEQNPKVRTVVVDPMGSGLFCLIKEGKIESQGSSITEGIGIMRKTANFALAQVDDAIRVSDQDMVDMVYHLAQHDGLVVGTSAALNVFALYQMALQARGSGQSFVTILCDHGSRYQARLFNPVWLAERKLTPKPLLLTNA